MTIPIAARLASMVIASLFLLACDSTPPPDKPDRPNVLIVTLDTLKRDAVGAYGHPTVYTPGFDRLATKAFTALEATAPLPLTVPSHAALFASRYPAAMGLSRNSHLAPGSAVMLAERLKQSGYATAGLTAALLRYETGLEQGFDHYTRRRRPETGDKLQWFEVKKEHGEDIENTDQAIALMDQLAEPFFIWVHYYGIHRPYQPIPPYDSIYPAQEYELEDGQDWEMRRFAQMDPVERDQVIQRRRADYLGEVTHVDRQMERLLAALWQRGMQDRTIIVAVADHGEDIREKTQTIGHGLTVHQSEMAIPLSIRLPEPVIGLCPRLIDIIDVTPTIISYIGLPAAGFEGRDLTPLLLGRRSDLAEAEIPLEAKRMTGIRRGSMKYIRHNDRTLLFDLDVDPGETHNLAPGMRELADQMDEQMSRRFQAMRQEGVTAEEDVSDEKTEALRAFGYME